MIYFVTDEDLHVLIIEPRNLTKLKAGEPMQSPDNKVLVCYTPDMEWLHKRFEAVVQNGQLDGKELDRLLKEAAKRPEINRTVPAVRKVFDMREN